MAKWLEHWIDLSSVVPNSTTPYCSVLISVSAIGTGVFNTSTLKLSDLFIL